jgi:hypothetical protein
MIVVILIVLENWRPWREEMGSDVDGNFPATRPAEPRGRIVPAE